MEAPHLQLTVPENGLVDSAHSILKILRPEWNLKSARFKVFTDGITNKLLGCFGPDSEDVILIRVYGNKTDMLIDRKAETRNMKLLHEAGLAPRLYATLNNGLVYEYVPGEVLTISSCRMPETYVLVAQTLADMHCVGASGSLEQPGLWNMLKKFLKLSPVKFPEEDKQKRFEELIPSKTKLENEYLFLEKELSALGGRTVFSHNDLLLANVIYNSQRNKVTFIDYEYAAYNYQAYDLANHFNEYAGVDTVDYTLFPDPEYQKNWIGIYLKRHKSNKGENEAVSEEEIHVLYDQVQKFTLASHFLWGVWALIQSEHSSIDFDFLNYADIRLSEYFIRKRTLFESR